MHNDIEGASGGYHAVQAALRRRELPAWQVATRLRLSKDSTTYLASRAGHKEAQYEALLAAGRTQWTSGERVRFYQQSRGTVVWIPDEADDLSPLTKAEQETDDNEGSFPSATGAVGERRDYDVEHYLRLLRLSYAERLRVAFEPEDFEQVFRLDGQTGLFDRPLSEMRLRWIRCAF